MCGRYYVESEEDIAEMNRIIEELDKRLIGTPERASMKSGEIYPSDTVPVISNNKQHKIMPFLMKWGYTGRDGKGLIINARSESVYEKPMFRQGILSRRCLVPATNYFEWEKHGTKKIKYALRVQNTPVIYMAGIYRFESEQNIPRFVILTRPASESISFFHDRMPVNLPVSTHDEWLSGNPDSQSILSESVDELEYAAV